MILRINFTTDGHDGISESSHKHATLNYKDKLKNQTLTKDSKQNLKTKSESETQSQCNGTPSTSTGGFGTWGCTLKKVGSQVCKFNKLTLNGRKKFHLKNIKLNDPVIEEVVMQVGDALSEQVLCLAPLAFQMDSK